MIATQTFVCDDAAMTSFISQDFITQYGTAQKSQKVKASGTFPQALSHIQKSMPHHGFLAQPRGREALADYQSVSPLWLCVKEKIS